MSLIRNSRSSTPAIETCQDRVHEGLRQDLDLDQDFIIFKRTTVSDLTLALATTQRKVNKQCYFQECTLFSWSVPQWDQQMAYVFYFRKSITVIVTFSNLKTAARVLLHASAFCSFLNKPKLVRAKHMWASECDVKFKTSRPWLHGYGFYKAHIFLRTVFWSLVQFTSSFCSVPVYLSK